MDLTEAEDIKKRWKEYREELYKKDLHDPDNHNGVITHLEANILECKVKWAFGHYLVNLISWTSIWIIQASRAYGQCFKDLSRTLKMGFQEGDLGSRGQ